MGDNFDISLIKYCDEDEKLSADDIPASDDDACAPFPEVPELSRAQWGEKLKPLLCSVTAVEWVFGSQSLPSAARVQKRNKQRKKA